MDSVSSGTTSTALVFPTTTLTSPSVQTRHSATKSLLKAAGREGLTITLWSSAAAPGMLNSATVFAQQAKAAGVTVNVNNGDPIHISDPNI